MSAQTTAHALTAVTDQTFAETVLASKTPVLVDFWAEWCAPCRMMNPILEQIAQDNVGVLDVVVLDGDANPQTMRASGVLGMPTLQLYVDGQLVASVVGARSKSKLLNELSKHVPTLSG